MTFIPRHGESRSKLYEVWSAIVQRCCNPNSKVFRNYGGRGIQICQEWRLDYLAFREWALSSGYDSSLQIDRIDNDGSYTPDNCRWVTHQQNQLNTRQNVRLTAFGETKPISEWLRDSRCIVGRETFRYRISKGCPVEQALTVPPNPPSHKSAKWWW